MRTVVCVCRFRGSRLVDVVVASSAELQERVTPAQPVGMSALPRMAAGKYMSERLRLQPCLPQRVETKRAEPRSTRLQTARPGAVQITHLLVV